MSETAYDLGTPGYDTTYGHGFVNADAAVRRAIAPLCDLHHNMAKKGKS